MPIPKAQLQTRFASQAVMLAESLTKKLGGISLGASGYFLTLTTPEDVTTRGGELATQHIRLISSTPGAAAILIGSANTKGRSVELRAYNYVAQVHRERFSQALEFGKPAYDSVLTQLRNFFEELVFVVTLIEGPKPDGTNYTADTASGGSGASLWIALTVLVLGGAGFAAYWFLIR